jgi:hypothetical protein
MREYALRKRVLPSGVHKIPNYHEIHPSFFAFEVDFDEFEISSIEERRWARKPSPDAPDTLGWRGWKWNGSVLISPIKGTKWHDPTLRAEVWVDSAAVSGEAGIHAARVPRDWHRAGREFTEIGNCEIHGIVERFGRYVLGTEGWRAEWVVIRELMAPDAETALALMRKYPEVRVHVKEQEPSNEDR